MKIVYFSVFILVLGCFTYFVTEDTPIRESPVVKYFERFSSKNEENKTWILIKPLEFEPGAEDAYHMPLSTNQWYLRHIADYKLLPIDNMPEAGFGNIDLIAKYQTERIISFDTISISPLRITKALIVLTGDKKVWPDKSKKNFSTRSFSIK